MSTGMSATMVVSALALLTISLSCRSAQQIPASQHQGQIAFSSNRDGSYNIYVAFTSDRHGNHDIFTVSIDSGVLQQLTDGQHNERSPRWSPDGSRIAFVSCPHGNEDIYLMDAEGSNQTSLVATRLNDYKPCWSPDGNRIAFQYAVRTPDDEWDYEICIIDVDGENLCRVTSTRGWDTHPSWSFAALAGSTNE